MIHVVSTIRPAIFRSPTTGKLCLAGGLVISVNGVPASTGYPEIPEGTAPADIQWTSPSRTQPMQVRQVRQVQGRNGTYTVTIDRHRVTCTCPGYTFRRTCKHVKAAVNA
jgi:hypothetical protein